MEGFLWFNGSMKRTLMSILAGLIGLSLNVLSADARKSAPVDPAQWRGFNLLEKFTLRGNAPFKEDDFKWIAELGFNFVRLPMDYRCYTETNDWLKFRESALAEIDQAIEFGAKHGIHVCINLHRAPGFCINPPAEAADLWTDPSAQDAFVGHWVMFAKRYRSIPSDRLSFNLLNEPTRNTHENYLRVNCRTIEAIHKEDPNRLIIVDGNNVGSQAIAEFLKYTNVIQATRGYHPATISHYKASWMRGSDQWPEPAWPPVKLAGYLYGSAKPDLKSALVLEGSFKSGTEITLKLNQLSAKALIQARADGKVIAEEHFNPMANPSDWKAVKSDAGWTYHEPAAERRFKAVLTQVAREITFENVEGDWLSFSELGIRPPDREPRAHGADMSWGRKQSRHPVTADGSLSPPDGEAADQTLVDYLKPWREIAAQGETVFVGEWGCFNKTPHPVALAWMRSWLEQWKQARFGWALWNFRGSFGILDSGRSDVAYEDWRGHKLDRQMLNLLREYLEY